MREVDRVQVRKRDGDEERERERENVIMKGSEGENRTCLVSPFISKDMEEKNWKDIENGKASRTGVSYHLVEPYPMLSCETLTLPVAVFHPHQVFTSHCSTCVCHSITVRPVGSVNEAYYSVFSISMSSACY